MKFENGLDFHLAEFHALDTRALKRAVHRRSGVKPGFRRSPARFPEDFIFELNAEKFENLRSQSVILGLGKLGGDSLGSAPLDTRTLRLHVPTVISARSCCPRTFHIIGRDIPTRTRKILVKWRNPDDF